MLRIIAFSLVQVFGQVTSLRELREACGAMMLQCGGRMPAAMTRRCAGHPIESGLPASSSDRLSWITVPRLEFDRVAG